ncbi:glutamine amidotransferase [Pseudomonas sp. CT11-2]|uniref:glutamine amidotransferase n=1 Tax=unclassified Pseudomonas TaxID=196821 RepID=UPI00215F254F|nr:glutamine amidotransferase [Pseudomonas sp. B21-019]UVM33119.1 glutamine amidotransferase [Pseudomonas sp. B21-019]
MVLPKVLIVQVGTPPDDIRDQLGDLPAWFGTALGVSSDEVTVVRAFEGERLPDPCDDCVAIITGSWAMVTDREPWSEYVAQWIREAMTIEMPLFGVCYGHQLMAHALGGVVDYHPDGREVGCEMIQLLPVAMEDELLKQWPARFPAHLTHEQTVITLPEGAIALARSNHDPHQIIRYGRHAISTQYHPEFSPGHLEALIRRRSALLIAEHRDPIKMLNDLQETPDAQAVLRRFVQSHSK